MRPAAALVALVALWCLGQAFAGETALVEQPSPTFYTHPDN
jgi:hypothetical protein